MTPRRTQITFQYHRANPFLATADFLAKGIVTKAVTADEDVGSDIETRPYDFLP